MTKKIIAQYREYCSECRDERRQPANIYEWLGRLIYWQISEGEPVRIPV